MDGSDDRWLTVTEAASHLGMSRTAFQRLATTETLPVERHGRTDKIRATDLDAYIARCRIPPGQLTSAVQRAASRADPTLVPYLGVTIIDQLTNQGWTDVAICQQLGVNITAISKWRGWGVPPNRIAPLAACSPSNPPAPRGRPASEHPTLPLDTTRTDVR